MAEDKKEKHILEWDVDISINEIEITLPIKINMDEIDIDFLTEYVESHEDEYKVISKEEYEELEKMKELFEPLYERFKKESFNKLRMESWIEYYTNVKKI